jgi:hypothetical protein
VRPPADCSGGRLVTAAALGGHVAAADVVAAAAAVMPVAAATMATTVATVMTAAATVATASRLAAAGRHRGARRSGGGARRSGASAALVVTAGIVATTATVMPVMAPRPAAAGIVATALRRNVATADVVAATTAAVPAAHSQAAEQLERIGLRTQTAHTGREDGGQQTALHRRLLISEHEGRRKRKRCRRNRRPRVARGRMRQP